MGDNYVKHCSKLFVATGPLHKRYPFKSYKTAASDGTASNYVSLRRNAKSFDGGTDSRSP